MRTRTTTALTTLAITVAAITATVLTLLRTRYQDLLDEPDRGSVTLEKAILTAVVSALAIALGVIITAAVANHQAKIK